MNTGSRSCRRDAWICICALPRKEDLVAKQLQAHGFKTFFPQYERFIRHARRVRRVKRPLFPRYLFVEATNDAGVPVTPRWYFGVSHLVGGNAGSIVVGDVVDELRAYQIGDQLFDLTSHIYAPGKTISPMSGPMTGVELLLEEVDDQKRAVSLVTMLGKQHRIIFPLENLVAIDT